MPLSSAPTVLTPRSAESLFLQVSLPGKPLETAGVLLIDTAADRLYKQLRRDWDRIAEPEDAEVLEALDDDLGQKASEFGAQQCVAYLEDALSGALRITAREALQVADFDSRIKRLYREHVQPNVLPFRTHLPVWSLQAAAGGLSEETEVEPEGFQEILDGTRLTRDMFVAHVTGRSMEPRIPDGSLCIFRRGVVGSREGRLLLVEKYGDTANQGRYTIKRYHSEKIYSEEGWQHDFIELQPLNQEFEPWRLRPDEFQVIAEFVSVIE